MLIDRWRQGWLPWTDVARVRLEAGRRYKLKLEWQKDQGVETMRLRWKTPAPSADTSLWSEVGDGIDYYVVYGPSIDQVVAGYRRLTGQAPMMPRWAFGLWQCRERYKTAQESLDVVQRVPRAEDPARRDRAGLAVLAARPVGHARVRRDALPGSRRAG